MLIRLCLSLLVTAACAFADDHPQWLGPQRDGVYREAGVLRSIPSGGLKLRWKAPVGAGYAGPAVFGGKVIVMDRIKKADAQTPKSPFDRGSIAGMERIVCLDEKTGKELWKVEYECAYTISYAAGPRTTPAIDEKTSLAYCLGAEGHLHCVDINTGKVVWQKKLEGTTPTWGYAGHPLIDGEKLFLLTAGPRAILTAFDKSNGKMIWEALPFAEPGYCPPRIYTIHGKRQLVQWHPRGLAGLEIETGKVLWSVDHGPIKYGCSIVAPAFVAPDLFFITAEFEGGAAVQVDPSNASAKKLYQIVRKGRTFSTLHDLMSPMIVHEGLVIGIQIDGELRAVNPADGKIVWDSTVPTIGDGEAKHWYAAFITPHQPDAKLPPGQFFIANESGDLVLCTIDKAGCKEIGRAHLLEPTNSDSRRAVVWSHPAYANKSIYWRNDKEIGCWSLAE